MDPRITIITLGVADLKRATEFYRDGLGLPLRPGNEGAISFFTLKGVWLALYPRDELALDAGVSADGGGFSGVTLAHNVDTRDGVDELIAQAASAGGRVVKRAADASWGGYAGYFADPDGHLWEVAWNPHLTID